MFLFKELEERKLSHSCLKSSESLIVPPRFSVQFPVALLLFRHSDTSKHFSLKLVKAIDVLQ